MWTWIRRALATDRQKERCISITGGITSIATFTTSMGVSCHYILPRITRDLPTEMTVCLYGMFTAGSALIGLFSNFGVGGIMWRCFNAGCCNQDPAPLIAYPDAIQINQPLLVIEEIPSEVEAKNQEESNNQKLIKIHFLKSEIPEKYRDTHTNVIMDNPVILNTGRFCVDEVTAKSLLGKPCPFTGKPVQGYSSDKELKKEIANWVKETIAKYCSSPKLFNHNIKDGLAKNSSSIIARPPSPA